MSARHRYEISLFRASNFIDFAASLAAATVIAKQHPGAYVHDRMARFNCYNLWHWDGNAITPVQRRGDMRGAAPR